MQLHLGTVEADKGEHLIVAWLPELLQDLGGAAWMQGHKRPKEHGMVHLGQDLVQVTGLAIWHEALPRSIHIKEAAVCKKDNLV